MQYPLNGHTPKVHESAYLAPGCHVIGNVELQENSSVWFNAVLRGDKDRITIGKGSNIQDGAVVHIDEGYPVKVGENVIVGHNVTLHGCTVEDGALIGMGATVLNGAVIGKGALVAAGALVPERAKIEAGSLAAGVPAKTIRKLTQENVQRISSGAGHYINNAKMYRDAGIVEKD
ncbi:MAG TPA: gamma carbonic anhydrase family protein [Bacillales bacterium]|nr:gamma carbonic anhydrase family protein [Bacillales bacterium]